MLLLLQLPVWEIKLWSQQMPGDNIMFAATGITTGDYLWGVRFFSRGAMTNSAVMRSKIRTFPFIETIHHFDFKPDPSINALGAFKG